MNEPWTLPGVAALMQRIRSGDRQAQRELITRYGGAIYSAALQSTGDPERARAVAKATLRSILETPWNETGDAPYTRWIGTLVSANAAALPAAAPAATPAAAAPAAGTAAAVPAAIPAVRVQKRSAAASCSAPSFDTLWPDIADALPPRKPQRAASAPAFDRLWPDIADALPPRSAPSVRRGRAVEPEQDDLFDEMLSPQKPPRGSARKRRAVPDESDADPSPYGEDVPEDAPASDESFDRTRRAPRKRRRGLSLLLTVLLALVILILIWGILGLLSGVGVFPPLPLGYDWFNTAIYPLF